MSAQKISPGLVSADLVLLEILTIVAGVMLSRWWYAGSAVVLALIVLVLSRGAAAPWPRATATRTVGHGGRSHEFIAQAGMAVQRRRRLLRRTAVPAFPEYFTEATRYGTPAKP